MESGEICHHSPGTRWGKGGKERRKEVDKGTAELIGARKSHSLQSVRIAHSRKGKGERGREGEGRRERGANNVRAQADFLSSFSLFERGERGKETGKRGEKKGRKQCGDVVRERILQKVRCVLIELAKKKKREKVGGFAFGLRPPHC